MSTARTLPAEGSEPEARISAVCLVNFITEDHQPISGELPNDVNGLPQTTNLGGQEFEPLWARQISTIRVILASYSR